MFKEVQLQNRQRFISEPALTTAEIQNAIDVAVECLKRNLHRFVGCFATPMEENPGGEWRNRYQTIDLPDWTSGMWTGLYWMIYELTGDTAFRKAAESQVEIMEKVARERIQLNDHDTGFKFSPSCVAAYRLTEDTKARDAALRAAEILLERYCPVNKFIIRSGTRSPQDRYQWYRTLVDTMMNIPLLFWAYQESGEKKFYDAAVGHYNTTIKYLVREDGSSYHHFQFNPETFEPEYGLTFQGNRNESCWSRGHSWLVYGFPCAYGYTKDAQLIDAHRAVTYYFLNHLPADFVPYWDFDFMDGSLEPRDSSASASAICGLLEMNRYLEDDCADKKLFEGAADCMLRGLMKHCANDGSNGDGILLHSVRSKPHNYLVDTVDTYADYFYMEALMRRLHPEWKSYF